ncbi:MAG: twin-arginine translocation signal domain-containing protein, partial [Planctomycetota bacterium]
MGHSRRDFLKNAGVGACGIS